MDKQEYLIRTMRAAGLPAVAYGRRGVILEGMNGQNIQAWNMADYPNVKSENDMKMWAAELTAEAVVKCQNNGTYPGTSQRQQPINVPLPPNPIADKTMLASQIAAKEYAKNPQKLDVTPDGPLRGIIDFANPNTAIVDRKALAGSIQPVNPNRRPGRPEDYDPNARTVYSNLWNNSLVVPSYNGYGANYAYYDSESMKDQDDIGWSKKELELGVGQGFVVKQGDKILKTNIPTNMPEKSSQKDKTSTAQDPVFRIRVGSRVLYSSKGEKDKEELNKQLDDIEKEKELIQINRMKRLEPLYQLKDQILEYIGAPVRDKPWYDSDSLWKEDTENLAIELAVYDKATALVLLASLDDPYTTPRSFNRIFRVCYFMLQNFKEKEHDPKNRGVNYKASFRYRVIPRFVRDDKNDIQRWVPGSNPEVELKMEKQEISVNGSKRHIRAYPYDLGREPVLEEWLAFYQRAIQELEDQITIIKAQECLEEDDTRKFLDHQFNTYDIYNINKQNQMRELKYARNQKSLFRAAFRSAMSDIEFDHWWSEHISGPSPIISSDNDPNHEYLEERSRKRNMAIEKRMNVLERPFLTNDDIGQMTAEARRQQFQRDLYEWEEGLIEKCTTLGDVFQVSEYLANKKQMIDCYSSINEAAKSGKGDADYVPVQFMSDINAKEESSYKQPEDDLNFPEFEQGVAARLLAYEQNPADKMELQTFNYSNTHALSPEDIEQLKQEREKGETR